MVLVFSYSRLLFFKFTHNILCKTVTPFSSRSYYECMNLNESRLRFDCCALLVDVAACLATGKGNSVSINTMTPQMLRRLGPQGRQTSSPYTHVLTCTKCISFKPHASFMFSSRAASSSRLTLSRLMTLDHLVRSPLP